MNKNELKPPFDTDELQKAINRLPSGIVLDYIAWLEHTRPTPNAAGLDLKKLESECLNFICECVGAPKKYNDGKAAMRDFILRKLKASLQSGGWQEINNSNLEQFLDEIEFNNLCCGCGNQDYDLKKPFKALIEPPATAEEE